MLYKTLNVSFTVLLLVKYLPIKVFFLRRHSSWRKWISEAIYLCQNLHYAAYKRYFKNNYKLLIFFQLIQKKLHAFEINVLNIFWIYISNASDTCFFVVACFLLYFILFYFWYAIFELYENANLCRYLKWIF